MPRRDGFWLIAQLRGAETAGSARLPALALTAHVSVEMQLRAREAGFDAYLPKPLDREELARGVGRLAAMRTAVRSVRL
jgi:CheY-like chemotaxis protein